MDAHLIKKTGNPKWNPSWEKMTADLPNHLVERLFFGISSSNGRPVINKNFSNLSSNNNKNTSNTSIAADSPKQELELMNQFTYYDYPHRPLSNLPTDRDVKRVVVDGKGK